MGHTPGDGDQSGILVRRPMFVASLCTVVFVFGAADRLTCAWARSIAAKLADPRQAPAPRNCIDCDSLMPERQHHSKSYDAEVPRTSPQLESDAIRVAKAHAQRDGPTIGQAVSDLVRRAAERPLVTDERSGLRVLHLNRRSPKAAAATVDGLREEVPYRRRSSTSTS